MMITALVFLGEVDTIVVPSTNASTAFAEGFGFW